MRLTGRLARLERTRGNPVRIAGWFDSCWQPWQPSDDLRQHVEEQAALLGPARCEGRYAVLVDKDTTRPFIVLVGGLERDAPLQVVELS